MALKGKAGEAYKDFEEARDAHNNWISGVERQWRAYKAIPEEDARIGKDRDWRMLTPPYANHIVETSVSALLDERLKFAVRVRPRLFDPGEFALAQEGAKALEILLGFQLDADRFQEKQRDFVLQDRIAGLTVAKVYWRQSSRLRKRLVREQREVFDPETGLSLGFIPGKLVETDDPDTVYDGPCVEVIDIRDFFWDEAAVSLEKCGLVAHRIWVTPNEARLMEKQGLWENVSQLKETKETSQGTGDDREFGFDSQNRTKGRLEVVEIWKRENDKIRVYTIAEGAVKLREKDHPYWHGELPFITCSTQTDLFRIPGQSQVERIRALQEALWMVADQRLRNLILANNGIVTYNSEMVDDPDAMYFEPRAQWAVTGDVNAAVKMWSPDTVSSQISLPAEAMLKKDMLDLSQGFPFSSTGEARDVGANTATEAALVSSLGQRSITQAKSRLNYAYRRIGQQMLELNQQYVRDETWVRAVGADNAEELFRVVPEAINACDYEFDIGPMDESLMRQERRAEAQTLYQIVMQSIGPHLMAAQAGVGRAPNLDAFLEDLLEQFDKKNTERYFVSTPPPIPAGGPEGQPQPGQPQGQTNPGLAAGPQSPSNQLSMSPEMFAQRAGAATGGGRSA